MKEKSQFEGWPWTQQDLYCAASRLVIIAIAADGLRPSLMYIAPSGLKISHFTPDFRFLEVLTFHISRL